MHDLEDLFGQVPVTWPEVVDWCARVAGITPDSPRFIPYVRAWRVTEKIAASKLAGTWPAWQEDPGQLAPAGTSQFSVVNERRRRPRDHGRRR